MQIIILTLGLLVLSPASSVLAQDFPDVCQEPENIMPNCGFDNGLAGWQPFLETGGADISVLQGGGECHAPLCPAAYIVTNDHFIGGIYQQVPVTPGNSYYANIVWLVFDSLVNDAAVNSATGGVGRRIGVDPFGGVDPRSPNIVWSEDNWRNDCKICGVEHVTVTAQADTITVFLRIDNTWRLRAAEKGYSIPPSKDQFWLDDIGLKLVGEGSGEFQPAQPAEENAEVAEAQTEPEPTPAPTDTPAPEPPTATPLPPTEEPEPATAEPEVVAQAEPTDEPEPTTEPAAEPTSEPAVEAPTQTPIPPPPTLTPTHTPPPTNTPEAQRTPTPRPTLEPLAIPEAEAPAAPLMLSTVGTLGCVGGLGLSFVGAIMAGLVWLYRLGWGSQQEDDNDDEYYYDEVEPDEDTE